MCNVHVHTNRVCLLCFVLFCCLFVLLDCFVLSFILLFVLLFVSVCFVCFVFFCCFVIYFVVCFVICFGLFCLFCFLLLFVLSFILLFVLLSVVLYFVVFCFCFGAYFVHMNTISLHCCDITVQSIILTLVRLHDLQHLLILYPNKRKDEVFGKYYAPPRKRFCCVHGWMLPCSQVLEKGEGELVPMFTHTHKVPML